VTIGFLTVAVIDRISSSSVTTRWYTADGVGDLITFVGDEIWPDIVLGDVMTLWRLDCPRLVLPQELESTHPPRILNRR